MDFLSNFLMDFVKQLQSPTLSFLIGSMAIRNSNLTKMVLPVLFSVVVGILIVFIARYTLAKLPKLKTVDAIATEFSLDFVTSN